MPQAHVRDPPYRWWRNQRQLRRFLLPFFGRKIPARTVLIGSIRGDSLTMARSGLGPLWFRLPSRLTNMGLNQVTICTSPHRQPHAAIPLVSPHIQTQCHPI
jgi:hypothetical protein